MPDRWPTRVDVDFARRLEEHRDGRSELRREVARRDRRAAFWRGLVVGVALGIPATATATWIWTGVNLLVWWR